MPAFRLANFVAKLFPVLVSRPDNYPRLVHYCLAVLDKNQILLYFYNETI